MIIVQSVFLHKLCMLQLKLRIFFFLMTNNITTLSKLGIIFIHFIKYSIFYFKSFCSSFLKTGAFWIKTNRLYNIRTTNSSYVVSSWWKNTRPQMKAKVFHTRIMPLKIPKEASHLKVDMNNNVVVLTYQHFNASHSVEVKPFFNTSLKVTRFCFRLKGLKNSFLF